jgi:hypothetical protein
MRVERIDPEEQAARAKQRGKKQSFKCVTCCTAGAEAEKWRGYAEWLEAESTSFQRRETLPERTRRAESVTNPSCVAGRTGRVG